MQVSVIKLDKKFTLRKHIHTKISRKTIGTQETWIVINGEIKVTFYDTDKTKICSKKLKKEIFLFYIEVDMLLML